MKNSFITVGISHWKSPVDIREKFSIKNEKNKLLIQEAKKIGIKSIFIISTCNRTQIFANNANQHTLKKLLINYSKGNDAELKKFGFVIKNQDAINNLFEISTGIDSQILGDMQIFSQVKESIKIAKSLKSIDSYTDRLLQFVFKANKEVQNFTNISKGAASIAHAVNLFIQEIFNDYKEKRILLFGLGDIGKITTENIIHQGSKDITIINRTSSKTKKIAEKLHVKFEKIENLDKIIQKSQVSILYLKGYESLPSSTIVSILLETLFNHRSVGRKAIPPFFTVLEEAQNFIPSRSEGQEGYPSVATIKKIATEGRKFGSGLMLVSQRPYRLDETVCAQMNSYIILRLKNERDQRFVKNTMENWDNEESKQLPNFANGQGIVSGQITSLPLTVQIKFDDDLTNDDIGDEDFISDVEKWNDSEMTKKRQEYANNLDKVYENDQRIPK